MNKSYRTSLFQKALIISSSIILALFLCHTPWLKTFEKLISDTLYLLRGEKAQPDEIVIVAIDEPSFAVLGMPWPWPRKTHANLIETLFKEEASAVVVDVIFGEPSNQEDDLALKKAVTDHPHTILASNIQIINDKGYAQQIITEPSAAVSNEETRKGLANLPVDNDGFIRRLSLGESGIKSLAMEAALAFCDKKNCKTDINNTLENMPQNSEINFSGPNGSIKTVSYYQALEPEKYLPKDFFKNKLVFVGLVTGVNTEGRDKGHDSYPMPYTRWKGGYMSGVEIHAHAAENIINGTWLREFSFGFASGLGIIAGAVSGMLFLLLSPLPSFAVLSTGVASAFAAGFMLFVHKSTRLPLTFVILPQIFSYISATFINYWHIRKEKLFITSAFSTYLSHDLVQILLKNPENLKPGGESVEATVMFLDFADFTSLSEKTPPDELLKLLNSYLEVFTDIIFKHEGMVDKFIGDAVMAVWGIPVKSDNHAQKACNAALEIKNAVEKMSSVNNGKKISVRMGINTGVMTAGNVGGVKHFNYTVIGDTVNTASRLEGVNKVYGTTIMAGQSTIDKAGSGLRSRFIDFVRVKGKEKSLAIYELCSADKKMTDNEISAEKLFDDALKLYSSRKWPEAGTFFRQASEANPCDRVYEVYSKRCDEFTKNPPPENWDGSIALEK